MPSVTMHRSLPHQLLLLLLALAPLPGVFGADVTPDEGRRLVPASVWSRLAHQRHSVSQPPSAGQKFLALVLQGLAITGLSLLFPTVITVNTGRRRRTVADSEDANMDQLAVHLGKILAAAVEGDECMQRVACEIGVVSSTLLHPRHTKLMTRLVTSLSPAKYTKLLNTFKAGATTEHCDKHTCSFLDTEQ